MPLIRCLSSCSSTPPQTTAPLWIPTRKCRLTREFMPRREITQRRGWLRRLLPGFTAHSSCPFWHVPRILHLCFPQISGHTFGNIALTIEVIRCFVSSKGSCPVVQDLPFIPEACSSHSCPNSMRFSFSLDQLQELTSTTWNLECSVKLCWSDVSADGVALRLLLPF